MIAMCAHCLRGERRGHHLAHERFALLHVAGRMLVLGGAFAVDEGDRGQRAGGERGEIVRRRMEAGRRRGPADAILARAVVGVGRPLDARLVERVVDRRHVDLALEGVGDAVGGRGVEVVAVGPRRTEHRAEEAIAHGERRVQPVVEGDVGLVVPGERALHRGRSTRRPCRSCPSCRCSTRRGSPRSRAADRG